MSSQRPLAPAPPSHSVGVHGGDSRSGADPAVASPAQSTPSPTNSHGASQAGGSGAKTKKLRRSKVAEACRFCRRSHMSCDARRPCGRCVKRDIAHLCRDEPAVMGQASSTPGPAPNSNLPLQAKTGTTPSLSPTQGGPGSSLPPLSNSVLASNTLGLESLGRQPSPNLNAAEARMNTPGMANMATSMPLSLLDGVSYSPASVGYNTPIPMLNANFNLAMLELASGQDGMGANLGLDMTQDPNAGNEFQGLGLSEFLQSLHDTSYISDLNSTSVQPLAGPSNQTYAPLSTPNPINSNPNLSNTAVPPLEGAPLGRRETNTSAGGPSVPGSPINKTERFLLTAADQKDGSRSDRLARVIHAKFEAGLLRPYNHVAGYTRLMRWMGDNMSQTSRQRTLKTLSEFRPAFRAIATGLTDLDLVFIEEAFERLLLDYDRVFSSMGIPSCLWRRTGEIYKGNKEFAALVGVPIELLQGGKLAIYELMAEESAVNYWEKYGNIAFDAGQKAVLTSCVLINQSILSRKRKKSGTDKAKRREDALINCCFSFTIRRDNYAIPSMIVGNFLRF